MMVRLGHVQANGQAKIIWLILCAVKHSGDEAECLVILITLVSLSNVMILTPVGNWPLFVFNPHSQNTKALKTNTVIITFMKNNVPTRNVGLP